MNGFVSKNTPAIFLLASASRSVDCKSSNIREMDPPLPPPIQVSETTFHDSFSASPSPVAVGSPGTSSSPSQDPLLAFVHRCALKWPERTGALVLARAAAAAGDTYATLLSRTIAEADSEQIALDVGRSGVDDLERIAPAPHDEMVHRQAIERLLRAWCARHRSSGYCQGMNFMASVLVAVMGHGAPAMPAPQPQRRTTPWTRRAKQPPLAAVLAEDLHGGGATSSSLSAAEEGASNCVGVAHLLSGEETAFWTFVAIVETILPVDFYAPPHMAGLQREVQVLQQLARKELPRLFAPASLGEADALAVLSLVAYKWLPPCFVNQLPLTTLLLCWDALLLRPSPAVLLAPRVPSGAKRDGEPSSAAQSPGRSSPNLSAGHLKLSLALLAACAPEFALRIGPHRDDAIGLAFSLIIESAAAAAAPAALIAVARTEMEVSPEQLAYLRARLAAADGKGLGGGPLLRYKPISLSVSIYQSSRGRRQGARRRPPAAV